MRTIDGYIRKVIQVNEKGSYKNLCYGAYTVDTPYKNSVGVSKKKIKTHSKNIIDLIEVGDILELFYNDQYDDFNEKIQRIVVYGDELIALENGDIAIEDIATILTHEQYEKGAYKIE